jgi:hypothetical protein
MNKKILNALVIVTSLFGYLEWGKGNHTFLFQSEAEVIHKLFTNPMEALHPFTVLPLIGQIILLVTLFQKNPKRILSLTGIVCLASLLLFMFFIGIISMNFKILLSTVPFIAAAIFSVRANWKKVAAAG